MSGKLARAVAGLSIAAWGAAAQAAWQLNLQTPATKVGIDVYDLHNIILAEPLPPDSTIDVGFRYTMSEPVGMTRKSAG